MLLVLHDVLDPEHLTSANLPFSSVSLRIKIIFLSSYTVRIIVNNSTTSAGYLEKNDFVFLGKFLYDQQVLPVPTRLKKEHLQSHFASWGAIMVRKLKHHEQRLLRKVDLITYKSDRSHREAAVRQRYHLTHPLDYSKYNALCGRLCQLAHLLANLDPADPYRVEMETVVLEKLHQMGLLKQNRGQGAGLSSVAKDVTVSAFCRRRLGVLMTRTGMVEHVGTAHKFIEQGHVRVGTEVVTDPAFLVSRGMEDFVTWVDGSKVKRQILQYREKLDDFDLL